MIKDFPETATLCSALIRSGEVSALEVAQCHLERISQLNGELNCFTTLTEARAIAEAQSIDQLRARSQPLPALAGVVYSVKNLFDVQSQVTLAGAKIRLNDKPADKDAYLVDRLKGAGAVLTGMLNMDAYAYGFTTENTHFGVTRNPHDLRCVAGGSSGGSAAAVAAGLSHFSLGSDTNGSIRVPASFCGIFGLKPTFGRLSRSGAFPFVSSLDHVGPLARNVSDLSLIYDVLQGHDPLDPAYANRSLDMTSATLHQGSEGLRIGVLTDYFEKWADPRARKAVQMAANALGAKDAVVLEHTEKARAAAFVITGSEAGSQYLNELRQIPEDFEPLSRERLLAGALIPAAWYHKAQRFRRWYQAQAAEVFKHFDVLIAPATPCSATEVGAPTLKIGSIELPTRPNVGLLTQPISFIGLPVTVAAMWPDAGLPIGVQLIAAPWREDLCLRAAWTLEQSKVAESRLKTF